MGSNERAGGYVLSITQEYIYTYTRVCREMLERCDSGESTQIQQHESSNTDPAHISSHLQACPTTISSALELLTPVYISKHTNTRLRLLVNICNASMQNEPPALDYDQLPSSQSVGESIAALALDPAYSSPDFMGILFQLKGDNIEALATETRYNLEVETALMGEYPPSASTIRRISCKVDPKPARGSYNLVFFIDFDDGKSWVLKVPASGHPRCWDDFAAGALESEAFTMRWIRKKTTIPVPEVYGLDTSTDNAIGCPYIMMEYIKGQSLYQGWFNPEASPARLEQFRARALQTIAAAMVQLHNFRFHTSGSLHFGVDGKPYGFQSAKVVDFLGTAARPREDPSMDALFAKKGPFNDPLDFLLFNLNRRESMYSDSARVRGLYESLRLFTQWTLEPVSGDRFPFVLGHPDFDLQNILVKEDGTLCGILDWDGIGAVPHTVGCLKYPLWLTRDWEPSNYNYDAATGGRKLKTERWENSPAENECYRAVYAQFIEAELSHQKMDGRFAKITRLSLLAGVLESADTVPEFLYETIQNLYGKIGEDVGEDVGEEPYELDGGFASSEKVGDSEEEEEEWQEAAELQRGDDIEPTAHVSDSEEQEADAWQGTADVQGEESTEPTELQSAITSPGEEVSPQFDCKKCRAAQILESSKLEDEPHVLNSSCSPLSPERIPQHASIRAETAPTSVEGDEKGESYERTVYGCDALKGRGAHLLSWMAQKLREAAEAFYVSADGHAEVERRSRELSQSDLAHANGEPGFKVEPMPMNFEPELEPSKDCPRNKKPIRTKIPEDQGDSSIAGSGDVWAGIGRMVQNRGVPSAMIMGHEAEIAEIVVQTMKREQNKAENSEKPEALKAMNAVYKTERYADITEAESSREGTSEMFARKLKERLGIGPSLAEARFIKEFKPVDMELARLDPAVIAAKKSDYQKPVVHERNANIPIVEAEQHNKSMAPRTPQELPGPERYDGIRSRVAENSEVEGQPQIRTQERVTIYTQIDGGNALPIGESFSYEVNGVHEGRYWECKRPRNSPVSRNKTQASSTSYGKIGIRDTRLRSSGPRKDGRGDKILFSKDTSDGGVPLDTKQAYGRNMVMDGSQSMKENELSLEEIGYNHELSFTTDENDAESSNKEYLYIDNGGFDMNDICVGLGEDTLDEERFDRLRMGFMQVLESTLGLI